MKKALITSLALVAVLTFSELASACTATGVYNRATQVEDTEIYTTVRGVVETDTVIQQEDWQDPDSTHAAVGTILREAWIRSGQNYGTYTTEQLVDVYDDYVSSPTQVRNLLNEGRQYPYGNHATLVTVRDHAIMHGNDWETGSHSGQNGGGGGGGYNPPPPPPPIDHAG